MKHIWFYCCILILSMATVCISVIGRCDNYEYRKRLRTCQAALFEKIENSPKADPFADCPSMYKEAVECVNVSVIEYCFNGMDQDTINMAKQEEMKIIGNQEYYCFFGGIPTIAPYIEAAINNNTKCKSNVSLTMVSECEKPFYDVFRKEPSSKDLCGLAHKTIECQMKILHYCNLLYGNPVFSAVSMASLSNVHCSKVQRMLVHAERNDTMKDTYHPSSWDVLTPVIVVSILILLALIVGFCFFAKKEARKNAEEKRLKKQKTNEKAQQIRSKENSGQPYQEGEELLPMPTVVTIEKDDISSV